MPMNVARRQNRQMIESNPSYTVSTKTAAYSMTPADRFIRGDTSAGAFSVTLPPVAECAGCDFSIELAAGAVGAAPNALTILPKGKDANRWGGNITLLRPGQYVVLRSDGERFQRLHAQLGAPSQGSKYFHEMFNTCPINGTKLGGPHSVTLENVLRCGSGLSLSYMAIVGQTLMPQWADPGLDIAGDQNTGDGWIIDTGIGVGNPFKYVVGTDPAFFFRVRFSVVDISGWDNLLVGFRKQAAKAADFNDYDDFAALDTLEGLIGIKTSVGNATVVATDTTQTWADGATHSFTVIVSAAGVVTYQIDDAAPTATAAYTFTNGLTLIPFIQGIQDSTLSGATVLLEMEAGYV